MISTFVPTEAAKPPELAFTLKLNIWKGLFVEVCLLVWDNQCSITSTTVIKKDKLGLRHLSLTLMRKYFAGGLESLQRCFWEIE